MKAMNCVSQEHIHYAQFAGDTRETLKKGPKQHLVGKYSFLLLHFWRFPDLLNGPLFVGPPIVNFYFKNRDSPKMMFTAHYF